MAPGSPGVAAHLIDPVWLVAATLHVADDAGMTGTRTPGVPSEAALRIGVHHLFSLSPTKDVTTTN
jgi:hypothetical protein